MRDLELLIFDCDGVLVDSEGISVDVGMELLVEAGIPITRPEMINRYTGMSWKDIIQSLETSHSMVLPGSLLSRSDSLMDERLERDVLAIAGIASVLPRLPYRRCICSNTKMSRLKMMLTKVGLWPFFAPNIFSAQDLGENRSKPKPDIFLHGAAQMGVGADHVVVIEDSVHGVQAARAAGMRVIGFIGGSHTYSEHEAKLIENGASVVIANMEDLPGALASLDTVNV